MATLEVGTTPQKRPPTSTVTLHVSVEMTYLTHTYLEIGNHGGGMGRGENLQRLAQIPSK